MHKTKMVILIVIIITIVLSVGGGLFYLTRTESKYIFGLTFDGTVNYYKNELLGISACDIGLGTYENINQGDIAYNPTRYCTKSILYQ